MKTPHKDNRLMAIGCILAAIGFASTQDAIVKAMSGDYSVYEAVLFRCAGAVPLLGLWLWRKGGVRQLTTSHLGLMVARGAILGSAYFAFVLAIAAMPIANTVAIYFTMPFFVAGLAGPLLGERVRMHRWMAIIAGFVGVLVMVRPGVGVFEPASLLALYSAFGYAAGQMMSRPISQNVPPIVMAIWQTVIVFLSALVMAVLFNSGDFSGISHKSLVFLTRPWVTPSIADALIFLSTGILAAIAMMLFINAYKYAESNFVAPFEYSSMIWAILYGLVIFGDFPDIYTWAGLTVVVVAGLLMLWRDRQLDRSLLQSVTAPKPASQ